MLVHIIFLFPFHFVLRRILEINIEPMQYLTSVGRVQEYLSVPQGGTADAIL